MHCAARQQATWSRRLPAYRPRARLPPYTLLTRRANPPKWLVVKLGSFFLYFFFLKKNFEKLDNFALKKILFFFNGIFENYENVATPPEGEQIIIIIWFFEFGTPHEEEHFGILENLDFWKTQKTKKRNLFFL